MKTFLEEKTREIFEAHRSDISSISIIIPNKRASIYLQKYLSNEFEKPFFSPEILTINEWIDKNTPIQIITQTELLFILYRIHLEIEKELAEDFNEFIKWGKIMLSDFDEIDRYMIEPKMIFRDLRNIKEIENWSFLEATLSEGQEKYMTLWDKLPEYYLLLQEELAKKEVTYQGAAYKKFAENLKTNEDLKNHYYFIGFNALSTSEERIIRYLLKEKKGTVFFDVDQSYFENKEHEAGHFYRKTVEKWGIKKETSSHFNASPKRIEVIETSQQIAQAKIAGSIVKNLKLSNANVNSTAIVLADETLLIPLTRSLPETIDKANITMGYPIKFSHLKSLIDIIFDFQFNFQKFNSARLYHKPMLNFLDHPFVRGMIQDDTKITFFEEEIIKRNKIFIEWDELNELIPNIQNLKLLFQIWENPLKDGFKAFNSLTEALYTTFKSAEDKQIDLEIIYHFAKGFKKFELISSAYPYILNLKSFKRLFHQFWQGESLSFLGNPVDGIQVMGILETRTLDFENLIVLGMNEGNLPKTNIINSFIPRDLKLTHGLPVEEDRQAIFAHHFYRLLHRAKNIYFTFNSTTDGVGASEKSRFITQLENELDWSKGHKMEHFTYTSTDLSSDTKDIRYPSSEAVHKRLDEKLAQGLSPSAVNKLINCPLDFYYRYILGMKESAVVEENIEASTFGTKIHDVLETIFKINFLEKNKKLDIATLAQERKKIKAYLTAAYLEDFSPTDIKFGQNKLSFDVSLRFIDDFILAQIKEIKSTDSPIYIKHLEKTISATYNWEINGEMKTIKIEGNADRIDQFGSTYRIIDYKSGKCDESKVTLDEKILQEGVMEKFMQSSTKGYGRQLLMYALMFRAEFPEITEFSVGIISMINLTDWIQNVKTKKADTPLISSEVLDCFEAELKVLITDLYASNYYFEHDPKSQYCENCQT